MHAADLVMDVTEVDTSATAPLGQLYFEPATSQASVTTVKPPANSGPRTWVYVYNDDSASLLQGTIVARDATTTTYDGIVAPVDTATMRLLGIAQHTIAAGSYGWILRQGLGEVLADTGGVTADNALIVGNAVTGRADNAGAVTNHAFAYSTETVSATALATCWINCPG